MRQRRSEFEKESSLVEKILEEATKKAREQAVETLERVKKAMVID